jgi:hypothetical protein
MLKGETTPRKPAQQGITSALLRQPAYRGIVGKIDQLRRRSQGKGSAPPEIGDRRSFHVRDVLTLSEWNEVEAELLARSARAQSGVLARSSGWR